MPSNEFYKSIEKRILLAELLQKEEDLWHLETHMDHKVLDFYDTCFEKPYLFGLDKMNPNSMDIPF